MATKTEIRRSKLRNDLIEAAEKRIAENGLATLKARDLARDAGCALGAIYNVFADMDELIFVVSSRTLSRLDEKLSSRIAQIGQDDTVEVMVGLAMTYLDFAAENPRLWSALFEHKFADGRPTPEWHLVEQAKLIGHIAVPLMDFLPDASHEEIQTLARALFSAVHGIVVLGMEHRFVAVPLPEIRSQIEIIVRSTLHGLSLREAGTSG